MFSPPGSLCFVFQREQGRVATSRRQNLSSQSSLCNHHGDLGLEPSWFPMLVKAALHPHQCPLAIATLVKVLGRTEACIFCSRLGRRPAAGRSPPNFCRRGVTLLSGDAPTPVTKGFRLPSTPRQGFLPGGMTGKTKRPQPKLFSLEGWRVRGWPRAAQVGSQPAPFRPVLDSGSWCALPSCGMIFPRAPDTNSADGGRGHREHPRETCIA